MFRISVKLTPFKVLKASNFQQFSEISRHILFFFSTSGICGSSPLESGTVI